MIQRGLAAPVIHPGRLSGRRNRHEEQNADNAREDENAGGEVDRSGGIIRAHGHLLMVYRRMIPSGEAADVMKDEACPEMGHASRLRPRCDSETTFLMEVEASASTRPSTIDSILTQRA
jgi:hypothetical protein